MKIRDIIEVIIKIIKGMIVGLGTITAGAGTFAIVLGIYDRCMEIIANPFKKFKENIIYVSPILLGILISFLLFKDTIVYLYSNYDIYVKSVFLGIIIGGLPILFKVANKNDTGSIKKYIFFIISIIFTIIFTVMGKGFTDGNGNIAKMEIIYVFIYGVIYGFGAIVPGMTTMHILIAMGVWGQIIGGILSGQLSIIIPFGLGYLLVVLLTANLMSYLFKRYYTYTYYAIIGFSITSIWVLVPKVTTLLELLICSILLVTFIFIVYSVSKIDIREKEENKSLGGN